MELNLLFNDIINLEKENYVDEARQFCQEYDETSSKKRLIDEHKDEDLIVYCYKHQMLTAFIRFKLVEKKLFVVSLQIKKGCEYVFRTLIRDTYNRLYSSDFDNVEGNAYKNNHLSIALQTKLSLYHSQDLGDRIGFLVSKEQFICSLKKYTKF